MNIGAHFGSTDLINATEQIKLNGISIIQIFINTTNKSKTYMNHLDEFALYLKKNNMICYIHSNFINNFCSDWDEYSYWINNVILEIKIANQIGAKGIILHFGKSLKLTKEKAWNNMFSALLEVLTKTKKYAHIKIFLETPAGQGTEICYDLLDISKFLNKFKINEEYDSRIQICLDTCHVHVAGYDLSTKQSQTAYFDEFDLLIGLHKIGIVHLNDAYGGVGCKVDRHANLGKGTIGLKGCLLLYDFFNDHHINMVLETPGTYKDDLRLLLEYEKIKNEK